MFVRPTWSSHGLGVAGPQQPIPRAPFKSSPDAPELRGHRGAKWEGVCSAQLSRHPALVHVQAVVEWVSPSPLTFLPNNGPTRISHFGITRAAVSVVVGASSTTAVGRPTSTRLICSGWHLRAEHGGLDGDAERRCRCARGAAYGVEVTGASTMVASRE